MQPRCLFGMAMVLATSGLAVAQTTLPVLSPVPFSTTLSFGVLGLAGGETLRINVVNVVRTAPPVMIPQTPCRVELDLYDSQGKLIKQKVIDNLGYGVIDFLDLDRAEFGGPAGRAPIAPVVKVGSNQLIFCSITPTIEVYDNATGRASTVLAVPAPSVVPRPLMLSQ